MMSIVLIIFFGILSAAGPRPTYGTVAYRQERGQIPQDLGDYDALIAVDHCGLIGHEGIMYAGGDTYTVLVYDCAGSYGAQFFSDGNDMTTPWLFAGDVGWRFWQMHPELVGTLVRIEIEAIRP